MTAVAQDSVASIQRELVHTERKLVQALSAEPTPALLAHLLERARLETAIRAAKQSSYLVKLETRQVEPHELAKAVTVQDRIRVDQAALLAALGMV